MRIIQFNFKFSLNCMAQVVSTQIIIFLYINNIIYQLYFQSCVVAKCQSINVTNSHDLSSKLYVFIRSNSLDRTRVILQLLDLWPSDNFADNQTTRQFPARNKQTSQFDSSQILYHDGKVDIKLCEGQLRTRFSVVRRRTRRLHCAFKARQSSSVDNRSRWRIKYDTLY